MPDVVSSLVSTIIPVHNRAQMVRQAIDSVLAQTHRPIEVVVVDDGSTDETPRELGELASRHPNEIRLLRQENAGPGPAREAGRQAARGEFIQYLDSDDLLRPRKFEQQVSALREHSECGAAYGYICVHPLDGEPLAKPFKASGETRETLFPWLLADRWWNTDCPLWRRATCDAVGPWTDLRWSQDWEYDGRAAALGTKLAHVKEFVCDERHHAAARQTTHSDWSSPDRIQARIRFLTLMLGHAEHGGVAPESPQRRHFTRWIFATARRCAALGYPREARLCMELAEQSAGDCRDVRRGFGTFRSLCRIIGTKNTGRLVKLGERIKRRPGEHTLKESFARDLT